MKKFFGTLILCLMLVCEAFAQNLSASVNRSTIPEGETLMLTLDYDGTTINDSPDLSVLDKDFTIYSVANSFGMQVVNGKMQQSRQWNLILMPKTTGELIIPAISLGQSSSSPLSVKVIKAGTASAETVNNATADQAATPKYFLRGRVNNNNPYVQQEIIYKLSLYDSGGLQGGEPVFEQADAKDWVIRSLGEPEVRPMTVNGKNMREIVFNYALFPQKSGSLTIPPARFEGYYLTKNPSRRDPFQDLFGDDMLRAGFGMADMFATRNPVTLRSDPIKVEVKAVPASNGGKWWLPAQNVMLYGTWDPSNPTFKVGEAVNRTIYLKADGVIDSQLPDIKFKQVSGLKQYPEKPQTQMSVENGSVVSVAKIANVYIPNKPGVITIPAVEIDWFNVKTGQYDKAVLPEATINVEGSAIPEPEAEKQTAVQTSSPKATPSTSIDNNQNTIVSETVIGKSKMTEIILLLIGAFGLGIVLSYLVLRPKNRGDRCTNEIRDYRKYIIAKAKDKDLRSLRDAIIEWCRNKYGAVKVANFNDVNKLVKDKAFEDELNKITAELYSDNTSSWNSTEFIVAFEKVDKKKAARKEEKKLLPDLYK